MKLYVYLITFAVSNVVLFAAEAGNKTKEPAAPVLEYKIQFEMRTLEMQYKAAQDQLKEIGDKLNAKFNDLKTACGKDHIPSIDSKTAEYVCVAPPKIDPPKPAEKK
jgi:hypothetical protein